IGLMWLAGRVMRSRGLGGLSRRALPAGARLEILDRKSFSKSASVALVRAGGRTLLIGVTEHGVSTLAEMEPELLELNLIDDIPGANGPAPSEPDLDHVPFAAVTTPTGP